MAEVTRAQAGTYRQIGERLRINHGPGKGETLSERPRNKAGRYLDDEDPTMLTLKVGDLVDVAFLIQIGAIAPTPEPAKTRAKAPAKPRAKPTPAAVQPTQADEPATAPSFEGLADPDLPTEVPRGETGSE